MARRPRPAVFAIVLTAAAAALGLSGCAYADVCPAIGYAYVGPVELVVPGRSPATAEVLACFGDDCVPAPAQASGDGWVIDIADSVDAGGSASPESLTAVVVEEVSGTELLRGVYPIAYERTDGGGRCPGPAAPGPVTIEAR